MALSRSVSVKVRGTPSAFVVEVPKLDVMSCRTTPEASSTFGPFVPSPGNGPAVSAGISTPHSAMARVTVGDAAADAAVAVVVLAVEPAADDSAVADAVGAGEAAPEPGPPGVQAAKAAAADPMPRNTPSERRDMMVERSNSRPRSWLGWGTCGSCPSGVRSEEVMEP